MIDQEKGREVWVFRRVVVGEMGARGREGREGNVRIVAALRGVGISIVGSSMRS